jgi:hypothetical protein
LRTTLDLPQAAGESHRVVVRNLSAGGANIADAVPGVGINDPMGLVQEGLGAKPEWPSCPKRSERHAD